MITNPARFTLDAIEHMRTLEDEEKAIYLNELIPQIMELDNVTVARIMHNILKTFSDQLDCCDVPNFWRFYKKFGHYILNAAYRGSEEHKKFTRLYTEEEANAK